MTLKKYYKNLKGARLMFRDTVLEKTEVSEVTFYRWINGTDRPNKLTREFIAKLAQLPEDKLFPVENQVEA